MINAQEAKALSAQLSSQDRFFDEIMKHADHQIRVAISQGSNSVFIDHPQVCAVVLRERVLQTTATHMQEKVHVALRQLGFNVSRVPKGGNYAWIRMEGDSESKYATVGLRVSW